MRTVLALVLCMIVGSAACSQAAGPTAARLANSDTISAREAGVGSQFSSAVNRAGEPTVGTGWFNRVRTVVDTRIAPEPTGILAVLLWCGGLVAVIKRCRNSGRELNSRK